MIAQISNHVEQALDRLLQQYKNSQKFKSILQSLINEIQIIENEFFKLKNERSLDAAVGYQLDLIGTIIGERRLDRTDEAYREALKSKILINISQGDVDTLIKISNLLTNSDYCHYINLGNGHIQLSTTNTTLTQQQANNYIRVIQSASAAGCRVDYLVKHLSDKAFAYDGVQAQANSLGYDDGSGTLGGQYADHYELLIPFAYAGDNPNYAGYGTPEDVLVGGIYSD
jgi:hypothetical protein